MIKASDVKEKKKRADTTTLFTIESAGTSVDNLSLPDPSLVSFYNNLDNRTLWIDDQIDGVTLELEKFIMAWNREDYGKPVKDRVPITLLFMSPGGDLEINNSLVDTITLSKTPVIGVNCGQAASAACFIFLACHKRYSFPNATFLIHRGSSSMSGSYDEVVAAILNYQAQIERLGEYILSRTKIDEDEFEENFSTDWYIDAKDAVEKGLCDKIIKSLDEIWSKK